MAKHIKAMTAEFKVADVRAGKCCQTIRPGSKVKRGDEIMFHGWEGRPYHSKWSWRMPYVKVRQAINILIFFDGVLDEATGYFLFWFELDGIARADGFQGDPTGPGPGVVMGRYFKNNNKLETSKGGAGMPAQIIKW